MATKVKQNLKRNNFSALIQKSKRSKSIVKFLGTNAEHHNKNDEVLQLLEGKAQITDSLNKCYSKPNLKIKHKLPAISESFIKTKPDVFKHHSKKINVTIGDEQGGLEKTMKLSDINIENKRTEGYEAGLREKIEFELNTIDTIISNEWKSKSLSDLTKENSVLRQRLKSIKDLLDELVRHKKYTNYCTEMNEEEAIAKQRIGKVQQLLKEKQLNFAQSEYQNLCNKADKLNDPFYSENLEKSCKELDEEIEEVKVRIKKLSINKKLGDYKMLKIAENTTIRDQSQEVNELMKELEKVKNQLQKNSEYSDKYDKVISEEKGDLDQKKEQYKDIISLAEDLNISITKKKQDKRLIEEIEKYKKELIKVTQSKKHLEAGYQIKYKSICKKSSELQQNLRNTKFEIEKIDKQIQYDKDTIRILLGNANKHKVVIKEEVIDPTIVMNEIAIREHIAARKIQSRWRKFINSKQNSRYSKKMRPLNSKDQRSLNHRDLKQNNDFRDSRQIISENEELERGKNIDVLGDRRVVTPPDVFEQGVQAPYNFDQ